MLQSSLTLLLGKGKVSDASLKAVYFLFLILVRIFCGRLFKPPKHSMSEPWSEQHQPHTLSFLESPYNDDFLQKANTISHSSIASTDRSNPVFPFCVLGYTGQNDKTKQLKFGI